MSSLLLVVVAFAFQASFAFRLNKRRGSPGESSQIDVGKFINGVQVYNYDAGLQDEVATGGNVGVQSEDAGGIHNWVVVLNSEATDDTIRSICEIDSSQEKCVPAGHPSEGGIAYLEVHGDETYLQTLISGHEKEIDFIEPAMTVSLIPDDMEETNGESDDADGDFSIQNNLWGLTKIGKSRAKGSGRGTHIYILDTGIRATHSDFGGRARAALDCTTGRCQSCGSNRNCGVDRQGHGTHCAGSAAGKKYGVASGASVYGVKVLGDSGSGSSGWIMGGLDWVMSSGKKPAVASMSLGGPGVSQSYQRGIDRATNGGVIVVVAAGNENSDACRFSPAHVTSAFTVGSTTSSNTRSGFSNYGRCVNIFGPGSDIYSASHRSDTGSARMSGTSMACPHVAGAAAIVLGGCKSCKPSSVKSTLISASTKNVVRSPNGSPNRLLSVVGLGSGGSSPSPRPSPRPRPRPSPRPTPRPRPRPSPRPGQCPSFAVSPTPGGSGNCVCPSGTTCYTGSKLGCRAKSNPAHRTKFLPSCTSCRCKRRFT